MHHNNTLSRQDGFDALFRGHHGVASRRETDYLLSQIDSSTVTKIHGCLGGSRAVFAGAGKLRPVTSKHNLGIFSTAIIIMLGTQPNSVKSRIDIHTYEDVWP
ncbi:predicted protein [Histoplasma capsulatum H143]|uniref:Uncharacterized protein n=1 Tax=Ajellomyces capsulatus (strain H143) TaxID=544712 RepID=C6HE23_AJECH|nr:predicted protein [Histoplasma capsulatum H143]